MPNRRSKSQFHGRIAALPEGVKQGGQGVSHGGLLNFAPSRQPVVFLKRKRRASFLSEGNANYPYGVSVLVRLRARYSGDRYRNIGRARARAPRAIAVATSPHTAPRRRNKSGDTPRAWILFALV